MEEKNHSGVIPPQHTGTVIDTVESIELPDLPTAQAFFKTVKQRLLTVNNWHDVAGAASAAFQLVDEKGEEVARPVEKGDFFKIDIPGPGPSAGDGYDWVNVEEVSEVKDGETESVGIRVRPTLSPLNNSKDVAHFYSPESTSSFTVTREGTRITAGIYDRNTKPNQTPETLVDKIRDLAVGAGAVTAFSKMQWTNLAKGLLKQS
ncbi:MAG: hypothetical protein EOO14_24275 [Chitinophagaceae bacterium]|nr:MAG: hypothetical protein EOO14_24275 [Chitinophagaceae bacterium]